MTSRDAGAELTEIASKASSSRHREEVGLAEDHQVGAVQLVLEQLLDRAVVLNAGNGGALGGHRGRVMGEAPGGRTGPSTTVTTPSTVTLAYISGQQKALSSGCGKASPEVSMTMWSGGSARAEKLLHCRN